MLPATQHVLGYWVHVVTSMLPSVIVVIAAREYITLAGIVVRNITFLRTSENIKTQIWPKRSLGLTRCGKFLVYDRATV